MKRRILAGATIGALLLSRGASGSSRLDALVEEGLAANRTLAQERLAAAGAERTLGEATRRYFPSLAVNARLSERSGAITDLGSLMNPAFEALNQITGTNSFPTDLELRLPQRQETSLRLTQPLFEPGILAGRAASAGAQDAARAAVAASESRLAADFRIGYLQYAKALRVVELYDSTLVLVNEVVRVQEALREVGQATPDQVLRARADRSEVTQRRADAIQMSNAAREQLNVALGRPVEAPLERLGDPDLAIETAESLEAALARAEAGRAELAQADGRIRAMRGQLALAHAEYLPAIDGVVDWGIQGEDYRATRDDDYLISSLVLRWNLFDGGQREARRARAQVELERARIGREDVLAQIRLDVRTSWERARVSREALGTARDRLAAARRSFELVSKRHANGAATLLELMDARTSYTEAGLNEILTVYDCWQRAAELERAAALYPKRSDDLGGDR